MRKYPKEPLKILQIPKEVDQEKFLIEKCKIYSPFTVSAEYNIDINYLKDIEYKYSIKHYLKSIQVENPIIYPLQEQIILSGIIGDGRIKRYKNDTYSYIECHKIPDEREYCEWKFFSLGDLTKGMRLYGKNFNNEYSNAIEFSTRRFQYLKYYYDMTFSQVISKLDIVGLMLLILDDGWFSRHSHSGNFCLAQGMMSEHDLQQLCERYKSFGIDCSIIFQNKQKKYKINII